MNQQISEDPVYSKYDRIGHFANPPTINVSDEMIDFDGIDLVSDEDDDFVDNDDGEDC